MSDEKLQIHLNYDPNINTLYVEYLNLTQSVYYLDSKLAFANGKYTLDCLKIRFNGLKVERVKRYKGGASIFPNGYLKIHPDEIYKSSLDLSKHFYLPENGTISILFDGMNLNPLSENIDHLTSNPILIDLKKLGAK